LTFERERVNGEDKYFLLAYLPPAFLFSFAAYKKLKSTATLMLTGSNSFADLFRAGSGSEHGAYE